MKYVSLLIASLFILHIHAQEKLEMIMLKDSVSYLGYIKKTTDSTVVFSNGAGITQTFKRADILYISGASANFLAAKPKKEIIAGIPAAGKNLKIGGALGAAGTVLLVTGFILTSVGQRKGIQNADYAGLAFLGLGLTLDVAAFAEIFAGGKKLSHYKEAR